MTWRFLPLPIRVALVLLMGGLNVSEVSAQDEAELPALLSQYSKLYQSGKFNEAIPVGEKIVELREKSLGPDHPGTGAALNNLAELYRTMGAFAKAAPFYDRA